MSAANTAALRSADDIPSGNMGANVARLPTATMANSSWSQDRRAPVSAKRYAAWGAAFVAHLVLGFFVVTTLTKPVEPPPDEIVLNMTPPPILPKLEPPKTVPEESKKPEPPRPQTPPRIMKLRADPVQSAAPTALPSPPPPPPVVEAPPAPAQTAPPPTYLNALYQHLAQNKHYPRAAQSQHIQGVAYLRFTTDRQGHVLRHRLEKSSGHPILDEEVEALIERAQPLPALPPEMPDEVELIVPIQFSLK